MENYDEMIGKNIKEVRLQRGMSQETLAVACDFSNTTLSAYENGRKIPNLVTIAKIAKNLKVSIERLYYGDENNAFIISAPDEGKKIVNAVYYLWKAGVISYFEEYANGKDSHMQAQNAVNKGGSYLYLQKFPLQIKRLITSLKEFEEKKDTYPDQDKYLEFLMSSVATEINNKIAQNQADEEKRKQMQKSMMELSGPVGRGE